MNLVRGQKVKLDELKLSSKLSVSLRVAGPAREYDLSVFGLSSDSRLEDDRYFVFYNNKSSPEGALTMRPGTGNSESTFEIDLSRLPPGVTRLMFTATVDDGDFSQISSGGWRLLDAAGREVAAFTFGGADFSRERAVMIGELYLKDVWRGAAVGQGFNGGLAALVSHFGGTVSATPPKSPAPSAAPPPQAPSAPPRPVPTPTPPAPPVSLTKVTLEKRGQEARISLRKDGQPQRIHVNLNWDQRAQPRGGLLSRLTAGGNADLDLGCMYMLKDGSAGVIQALGNNFGSDRFEPFIYLDKDDRSGASSDGENLFIVRPDLIHTVLLFAFIYEGTSDFTHVGGRLTMRDPAGNEIKVNLSNPDMRRTFCGIAMIENIGGEIKITKEERYFAGHKECDEHFGFGFRWSAGSKS